MNRNDKKPKRTKKQRNKYISWTLLTFLLLSTPALTIPNPNAAPDCGKLIANCESCGLPTGSIVTKGFHCYWCNSGYLLSSDGMECYDNKEVDKCLQYMAGCVKCTLPEIITTSLPSNGQDDTPKPECLECKKGMFLDESGHCLENESPPPPDCEDMIENCSECETASFIGYQYTRCKTCEDGYDLANGKMMCNKKCTKEFCIQCTERSFFNPAAGGMVTIESCSSCESGYELNKSLNQCEKKKCEFEGCARCDEFFLGYLCVECSTGFMMSETGDCIPERDCEEAIPACASCKFYSEAEVKCSYCKSGYYVKNNECHKKNEENTCNTIPGCLECSSVQPNTITGTVTTNDDGTTSTSTTNDDGSVTTQVSNADGTFSITTVYTYADGSTKTITSDKVCTKCITGYEPDSATGRCKWIQPDCSEFENCQKCGASIDGTKKCYYCKEPFFLNDEGQCEAEGKRTCSEFIKGCEDCGYFPHGVICHTCQAGYTFTFAERCRKEEENDCTQNDPHCVSCNNFAPSAYSFAPEFACYECKEGFFVNAHQKCEEKVENECTKDDKYCLECENNAAGEFKCSSCQAGYFVNGFDKCQVISSTDECFDKFPGCGECGKRTYSDELFCKSCAAGFIMVTSGECKEPNKVCNEKIQGCMDCFISDSGMYLCNECLPEFIKKGERECERHDDFYYCAKADPFCHKCELNTDYTKSCTECLPGYILTDKGECQVDEINCPQVQEGCESCGRDTTGEIVCYRCFNDFLLTKEKKCKKLDKDECQNQNTGCIDCSSDNLTGDFWCNVCMDGYYLSNFGTCMKEYKNECLEKIPGCLECGENDAGESICRYCNREYFLSDSGKCEKLNKCGLLVYGCNECDISVNGEGRCYSCSEGLILSPNNNGCIKPYWLTCHDFVSGCLECDGLQEYKDSLKQDDDQENGTDVTTSPPLYEVKCTKCPVFMKPSEDGKSCIADTELKCDSFFKGCKTCENLEYFKESMKEEFGTVATTEADSRSSLVPPGLEDSGKQYPKCTECKEEFQAYKEYNYLLCIPKERVEICQKEFEKCLECISSSDQATSFAAYWNRQPSCYICEEGYIVNEEGKCEVKREPAPNCYEVIKGCRVCYADASGEITTCEKCYFSHELTDDGKCEYTPPKCEDFISHCDECENLPNYQEIIEKAHQVAADITSGASPEDLSVEAPKCKTCSMNYEVSSDKYYCKPKEGIPKDECHSMIENCISCGTPTAPPDSFVPQVIQCFECEEGFDRATGGMKCIEKENVDKECQELFPNCLKCQALEVVTLEADTSNAKLASGIAAQKTTDETLQCYECKPGYFKEGRNCLSEADRQKEEPEPNNCDSLIPGCKECTIPEIPEIPEGPNVQVDVLPPTCQKCVTGLVQVKLESRECSVL